MEEDWTPSTSGNNSPNDDLFPFSFNPDIIDVTPLETNEKLSPPSSPPKINVSPFTKEKVKTLLVLFPEFHGVHQNVSAVDTKFGLFVAFSNNQTQMKTVYYPPQLSEQEAKEILEMRGMYANATITLIQNNYERLLSPKPLFLPFDSKSRKPWQDQWATACYHYSYLPLGSVCSKLLAATPELNPFDLMVQEQIKAEESYYGQLSQAHREKLLRRFYVCGMRVLEEMGMRHTDLFLSCQYAGLAVLVKLEMYYPPIAKLIKDQVLDLDLCWCQDCVDYPNIYKIYDFPNAQLMKPYSQVVYGVLPTMRAYLNKRYLNSEFKNYFFSASDVSFKEINDDKGGVCTKPILFENYYSSMVKETMALQLRSMIFNDNLPGFVGFHPEETDKIDFAEKFHRRDFRPNRNFKFGIQTVNYRDLESDLGLDWYTGPKPEDYEQGRLFCFPRAEIKTWLVRTHPGVQDYPKVYLPPCYASVGIPSWARLAYKNPLNRSEIDQCNTEEHWRYLMTYCLEGSPVYQQSCKGDENWLNWLSQFYAKYPTIHSPTVSHVFFQRLHIMKNITREYKKACYKMKTQIQYDLADSSESSPPNKKKKKQ